METMVKYEKNFNNPDNLIICDSCNKTIGEENMFCRFWEDGDETYFEDIDCEECNSERKTVEFKDAPKLMQRAILDRLCNKPEIKIN